MQDNNFSSFISKLSQTMQNSNILENLILKFRDEYQLFPVIGIELEFYLSSNIDIEKLEKSINRKIKQEKGLNQYEIDLEPSSDIIDAIKTFYYYKDSIEKSATMLGGYVDFNPKPFKEDYGSSVHIHINFLDHRKENFFAAEENLLHASRSICDFILPSFLVFANNSDHYNRLNSNYMNPVNISMGKNNRTTCLRVPYSLPKRIEHRLSPPDIDLYIAIFTILNSIYKGLQKPDLISHYDIIYGNAFDSQYNCQAFPKNSFEAKNIFQTDFFGFVP